MKSGFPGAIAGLILAQFFCTSFFIYDLIVDFEEKSYDLHLGIETIATLTLVCAIVMEISYLKLLLQRKATLERNLRSVSAEFQHVIESHFDQWDLTPSERDVAALLIKGLDIPDIAKIRGSADGTVKVQLSSIYKKSNSRNRADVLIRIIDALVDSPARTRPLTEQVH